MTLYVRSLISLIIAAMAGFFVCQSVRASYIRAIRRSLASLKAGPMICRPIGRPASSKPHGTLIPGMPARLTAIV